MRPVTRKIALDYGGAILAAVVIAVLIRIFVIEAYRIPTAAMHPALEPGDTIFVAKAPLGYDRTKVERGDVVVFAAPADPEKDYIKRVVGLPGDMVEGRKGRVVLNSRPLTDSQVAKDAACGKQSLPTEHGDVSHEVCWELPLLEDFGPEKVPQGSVFVLGDLRSQNPVDLKKRKTWGIVPVDLIKGKAKWIWLSVEPHNPGMSAVHFPRFRFERMFRRIE